MSIIHRNSAFGVGDFIFVAVGLLCVVGFFFVYPSQEPRSVIKTTIAEDSVAASANQVFRELGYSLDGWQASDSRLQSRTNLLDSLQFENGRSAFIDTASDAMPPGLNPYYWEVNFSNIETRSQSTGDGNENIDVRLDEQGRLIEFLNSQNSLPDRPVRRKALIHAFEAEANLDLWKTLPDSAWDKVLRFDFDEDYNSNSTPDSVGIANTERSHTFQRTNIERLMDYYLQAGGWESTRFEFSEIQIETVHSQAVADVTVDAAAPIMGQNLRIKARLLSSGALVNLDATYNPDDAEPDMPGLLEISRISIVPLFALVLIILFYFRIRSRAIDTRSALIAGILTGLIVSGTIFLREWGTHSLLAANVQSMDLLGLALQMGFSGAFTSVGVFALFAVGDSIMRQYWPQKLYTYDYLRQGSFFNKPIGEMILRSMSLTFILCGIWAVALSLAPNLFFEIERTFIVHEAAWAPIYLLLNSFWFSLLFALCI